VGAVGRPDLLEEAAGQVGSASESAHALFRSVQKLKMLPEFLQVWPAHGAGSACGKSLGAIPTSTIGYEARFNPALLAASSEQGFVDYILSGQPEPPLYFARMKRENLFGPKLLGALPEPSPLTLAQLNQIDGFTSAIIDTRDWAQFKSGHLPGSFFHMLNKSFITDIGSMVGDEPEIYLVCAADVVQKAVRCLVRIGLDRIRGWIDPSLLAEFQKNGGRLAQSTERTVAELREGIETGSVHILDVRAGSEYAESHIPGAQNIIHTRLATALDKLPKAKPLIVHCQGGGRSAISSALLKRAGFDVANLQGGFQAWQRAGGSIE
jgi:hydroxyacylglutathione hydrolase